MNATRDRILFALVSLGLAVLLWVYVVGQKESEWPYTVPVSIDLTAIGVVGTPQPERVSVVLRGPRRILDEVAQEKLSVRLVLAEPGTGDFTRTLTPSMIREIPPGVEIVRMEPSEVVVSIRPLISKKLQVQPRISVLGERSEYRVAPDISVDPARVEVRGSKEEISRMTVLTTEELFVEAKPGKRTNTLRVVVPDGVIAFPSTVNVVYDVVESDPSAPRPSGGEGAIP